MPAFYKSGSQENPSVHGPLHFQSKHSHARGFNRKAKGAVLVFGEPAT